MTLLGKSFTVVIFLLSVAFMLLALAANATHRNWRDLVLGPQGYKAKITELSELNQQLASEKEAITQLLNRERMARRTALAALETQRQADTARLKTQQERLETLIAANTTLTQTNEINARDLEQKGAQVDELGKRLRTEQGNRDAQFQVLLTVQDDLQKARGWVAELKNRNESLLKQVAAWTEIADHYNLKFNDPLDGAPPELEGKVVLVDRGTGLVSVSIGSDDGIKADHELYVSRDQRYITKLKIVKTSPNRAVAEIVKSSSNGFVQEGDNVNTTLH